MELPYVLVLLIVSYTTASPYGYGTKGGAVARADASATSGAYTGVGDVPVNIPTNTGYSGSFSKSYSSSSASSSASSSSNSYSYSGSGSIAFPGAVGCGTGNCHGSSTGGTQGSAGAGSQAYGSLANANGLSSAGGIGGKTPSGSYGHKYKHGSQTNQDDCGSEGCQGSKDTTSGLSTNSQATSDAKAIASSVAGLSTGSNCGGLECNNLNKQTPSDSKDLKCLTGDCETDPHKSTPSTTNGDESCASGLCGTNKDSRGSASIDYSNTDIHVPVSGASVPKSNNGGSHYSNNDIISFGSTSGSGCTNGGCEPSGSADSKPYQSIKSGSPATTHYNKPATHLTTPKLESPCTSANCQSGPINYSSTESDSKENNPSCIGGVCKQTKAPFTNPDNLNETPSSGYSSLPSVHPSGSACSPGTPGCTITPSGSGSHPSAPGYSGSTNIKPGLSLGTSTSSFPVQPSGPSCAPGNPSCSIIPSSPNCTPGSPGCGLTPISGPSECASGNCGETSPSASGGSYGISSSYSPAKPSSPACLPGTPGCGSTSTSTGYGGTYSTNPSVSHGDKPSYLSVIPCSPGTPGCATGTNYNCASGNCANIPSVPAISNNKPSYSHGIPTSYSPACASGTPGCRIESSITGPSGCASGLCGASPSSPGYSLSSNIKPINLPNVPGISTHLPNNPSGCASGNCVSSPGYVGSFNIKPSTSAPSNPSGFTCFPGTPGCTLPATASHGGSYAFRPSYSHEAAPAIVTAPSSISCSPGTPGCGTTPSILFGTSHDNSIGPLPSFTNVKPSACAPGSPGCAITSHNKDTSGCPSGICGSVGYGGSHSLKPSYSQSNLPNLPSCAPGSPGCTTPSFSASPNCVPGIADCTSSVSPSAPGYGASSFGTSLTQTAFGSHSTGSIQGPHNKPSDVGSYTPGSGVSALPAYIPGIGSPSYNKPPSGSSGLNNVGATAGASANGETKDKPPYTGGFGGPPGILKPNEFTYTPYKPGSSKPAPVVEPSGAPTIPSAITAIPLATSTIPSPAPTVPQATPGSCISGNCHQPGQTSPSHTGSNSGTIASGASSASADAVAYTGGFGGPPGFLKPFDNGKIDLKRPSGKQLLDSSQGLHQEQSGSGIHSTYSNGGSQIGGNAAAQANAGSVSSTGDHENSSAGGCGGGCGGSSDNYSSNAGSVASAGAVAKSVANASSDAKAFGGSYASSSASAHASAVASVKGGYGRR